MRTISKDAIIAAFRLGTEPKCIGSEGADYTIVGDHGEHWLRTAYFIWLVGGERVHVTFDDMNQLAINRDRRIRLAAIQAGIRAGQYIRKEQRQ